MFVRKTTTDTSVLLHRETIQKHGSHDQKTHGRKGGGGGSGGGGGGSGSDITDGQMRSVVNQIENAQNKISDFVGTKPGGQQRFDDLSNEDQDIVGAAGSLASKANSNLRSGLQTKNQNARRVALNTASENLNRAFEELEGAENERLRSAMGNIETALDKIDELLSAEPQPDRMLD